MDSVTATKGNRQARRLYGRTLRKGLTLIEAAMVLTILALVIGGVMLYYSSANQSRQTSVAAGQVGAIQNAVRGVFAGQSNYGTTGTALNPNIFQSLPASMLKDQAGSLQHAFNGPILVAAGDAGGGDGSGFTITLQGVPQQACLKLATMDLGRSTTGIKAVTGSGGGAATQGSAVGTDIPPMTPANAQSACGTATNSTVSWMFY